MVRHGRVIRPASDLLLEAVRDRLLGLGPVECNKSRRLTKQTKLSSPGGRGPANLSRLRCSLSDPSPLGFLEGDRARPRRSQQREPTRIPQALRGPLFTAPSRHEATMPEGSSKARSGLVLVALSKLPRPGLIAFPATCAPRGSPDTALTTSQDLACGTLLGRLPIGVFIPSGCDSAVPSSSLGTNTHNSWILRTLSISGAEDAVGFRPEADIRESVSDFYFDAGLSGFAKGLTSRPKIMKCVTRSSGTYNVGMYQTAPKSGTTST